MTVTSDTKRQVIDITAEVKDGLAGSGLVNVFAGHTTCAITVADMDPGTDKDYLAALEKMTPEARWRHPHDPGHFPDHLWSSVIGPVVTIPFKDGKLLLGSWQRIVLIELDGPQERRIELTIVGS